MALGHRVVFARGSKGLVKIIPDHIGDDVTVRCAANRCDQGFIVQRLEQIRSIGDAGNALCSRDGEAAFERGDGAGEPALFGGEELVAPVDRGAQRAMTFAAGAIARHQQREAIRKTGFDVVERESRASSGCELDRQRNPLEPAADPVDRRDRRRDRGNGSRVSS